MATTTIDLSILNGNNGFRLDGASRFDNSGWSVSNAGDVNGDGFDDVIVGSMFADPNGIDRAGSSYVVFGKASGFDATMNLSELDGGNGFRLDGVDQEGFLDRSVSNAGDVNGDGFDDVIVGTGYAAPNGIDRAGSSYVVFGKASGFDATMNLSELDGGNGFRVDGVATRNLSGKSVSGAGDVNGDGFDDVIVGAIGAAPNSLYSGSSYVVFGKNSGFGATLDLSSLDGSNGFRLDGETRGDISGFSVSGTGDVNGDGFDDLIVGSPNYEGSSYVVFGRRDFTGDNVIEGTSGDDVLMGTPMADIFEAGDGNDTMNGGLSNDTYVVENVGDKIIEKLNEGIDRVISNVTYTLSTNVENLTLTGAATINDKGNSQNKYHHGK